MIVRVLTPDGDRGQVVGYAVEPEMEEFLRLEHVLVATPGKPLRTYTPGELKVLTVEPEYGE